MTTASHATVGTDLRRLIALGAPVAATQLGTMMLGVVDILMVGQLGVHELDAASLGNIWLFGTLIAGMGIVFGIDPIVAQAHGRGDGERVVLGVGVVGEDVDVDGRLLLRHRGVRTRHRNGGRN